MKILANKDIRNLFLAVSVIWAASLLLAQGFLWLRYQRLSLCLLFIFLLAAAAIWVVCCSYFKKQNKIMEQAVSQINVYLDGDSNARIECDSEGELYRLFHSVNSLAAVLNAHADNELREKEFLKNTISDISHQLKTPLAALNIYNGLLHEEDIEASSVKEFADLSEQELDRMETLVQSLLKITRRTPVPSRWKRGPRMWRICCGMLSCISHTGPNRSIKNLSCPARRRSFFSATATG